MHCMNSLSHVSPGRIWTDCSLINIPYTNTSNCHQPTPRSADHTTKNAENQHVIEEALVEALAQEHFNYISEGGDGTHPAIMGKQQHRRSRSRSSRWGAVGFLLSPRTAMSVVTIVATAVAARHLRSFFVDFVREAFLPSSSSDAGGGAGVGVERIDVKR